MNVRNFKTIGDICIAQANVVGNDYVVGDIHGNLNVLIEAHKDLKSDDRLIIVGDLTDRGENNLGVIQYIVNNKAAPIIVLQGNHEDMCIETVMALESIAHVVVEAANKNSLPLKEMGIYFKLDDEIVPPNAGDTISQRIVKYANHLCEVFSAKMTDEFLSIVNHGVRNNGGMWLIKLFFEELDSGLITLNNDSNHSVSYSKNSKIEMIYNYLITCPFIFTAEGSSNRIPFMVAHSDIPLADNDERLTRGGNLTDVEKHQAIWDKQQADGKMPHNKRCEDSVLLIVGHQPVAFPHVRSVREESNTVNIDWAAYCSGQLLRVNVSTNTVEVFTYNANTYERLGEQKELIAQHLTKNEIKYQNSLAKKSEQPSFSTSLGVFSTSDITKASSFAADTNISGPAAKRKKLTVV